MTRHVDDRTFWRVGRARFVSLDAEERCECVLEGFGDELRSIAAHAPEDDTVLYVSEERVDEYGGVDAIESAGDSVHE